MKSTKTWRYWENRISEVREHFQSIIQVSESNRGFAESHQWRPGNAIHHETSNKVCMSGSEYRRQSHGLKPPICFGCRHRSWVAYLIILVVSAIPQFRYAHLSEDYAKRQVLELPFANGWGFPVPHLRHKGGDWIDFLCRKKRWDSHKPLWIKGWRGKVGVVPTRDDNHPRLGLKYIDVRF